MMWTDEARQALQAIIVLYEESIKSIIEDKYKGMFRVINAQDVKDAKDAVDVIHNG